MAKSRSDRPGAASYNETNKRRAHVEAQTGNRINVGGAERMASTLAGAALLAWGLVSRKAPLLTLPLGTGLVARGLTGHSTLYRWLGIDRAQEPYASTLGTVHSGKGIRIDRTVLVERPIRELYAFCRNVENLPRVLTHLESVIDVGEGRSHWIARGPAGFRMEWDAELLNEEEPVRIAWRSLPGVGVNHAGSLHFESEPGRGTAVRLNLSYEPLGGRIGTTLAKLLGTQPAKQIADDLQRFKLMMESGEASQPQRRESH